MLENGADINYLGNPLRPTFLMEAVESKNYKLVSRLLGINGIHVNAKNKFGNTTLHVAIFKLSNCTLGSKEEKRLINIIISLVRNKADVNLPDNEGISPFIYTLILNRYDAAKWMIENSKVNVNFIENGHNALFRAIFVYAKQKKTKEEGKTLISIIETLLEKEVDINHADQTARTPLIFAAHFGKTKIVQMLLKANDIDVNAQDQEGRTSLYYAVKNHNLLMVQALLAKGADPHLSNNQGISPLDLANQQPTDIKNSLISLIEKNA